MSQTNKKQPQYGKRTPGKASVKKNKWLMSTTITALIAVVAIVAVVALKGGGGSGENNDGILMDSGSNNSVVSTDSGNGSAAVQNADLIIPISEISTTSKFYPVEIDGTKLEVVAVEAPDGTIRTAFNTCQVCYDSGRGYYKQDGNVLVCQNCGNRFRMNQVEVQSGGCNPVPIFSENKTVTDWKMEY